MYGAVGTFYGPVTVGGRNQVDWPYQSGSIPPVADHFQLRDAATALDAATAPGSTAVVCQVLSGLGGVGKTQLAAHFARRELADGAVDLLVWTTATSRAGILSSYALVGNHLGGTDHQDPQRAAEEFLAWLANTGRRWLVVLDDLTEPGDLTGLWPPSTPNGRTVVTTRRRDAALLGSGRIPVEVGIFTPAEAEKYLRGKLAGRADLAEDVEGLAADLGYLPLALAQASAYLTDRGLTCGEYRKRFADRRRRLAELMPEPQALPDGHRATVAATWSLSIELANAMTPAGLARPLLELASHLDPNGVPTNIFITLAALRYLDEGRGSPPRSTGFLASLRRSRHVRPQVGAADARDALHCLQRLSLVSLTDDASEVRVHALVQRATREQMPPDRQTAAEQGATTALQQSRGADAILRFDLNLEEIVFGVEAPITMDTTVTCSTCEGELPALLDCRGCGGSGLLRTLRKLTVKIPPGVADGMRIRLAQQAEVGKYGGTRGDLYIEVHELPHDRFTRIGDDLHCTLDGSSVDLATGGILPIVGLDGATFRVLVPPRAHPGTKIRVPGQGVPHIRPADPGRGDLYVTLR
ncbi:DnaJ C-terminal domain-containing protein [Micromonospora peucetia]|uniref:DnaJ C-terminal domain-containing protein n=1 Tax=Micromonospora peucetia TaxID=47871 RepID=UPI003320960C